MYEAPDIPAQSSEESIPLMDATTQAMNDATTAATQGEWDPSSLFTLDKISAWVVFDVLLFFAALIYVFAIPTGKKKKSIAPPSSSSSSSSISPSSRIYKIAVGSKNPVKLNAALQGVKEALKPIADEEGKGEDEEKLVEAVGYDVKSGVSDQPMSDEETKTGACNRARAAFAAYVDANNGRKPDFAIGLEGGIVVEPSSEQMECSAWMAAFDGTNMGTSRTCSFTLPPEISRLVKGGMELGDADDVFFKKVNSKQKAGTVGSLTRGAIDRTKYYVQAVILALIPLLWKNIYFPAPNEQQPLDEVADQERAKWEKKLEEKGKAIANRKLAIAVEAKPPESPK